MILLSAGHYPGAPGACYEGFCEHEEASRWVSIAANLIRGRMRVETVPTGTLPQKVQFINSYPQPVSLACEIHFNSDASKRQRGSETLYCPGSVKGAQAAAVVQRYMADVLQLDRGAKEGWYRMDRPGTLDYPGDTDGDEVPDYFLSKTNAVALIVEPEFIYNRQVIEDNRHAACAALADALVEAAKVISS